MIRIIAIFWNYKQLCFREKQSNELRKGEQANVKSIVSRSKCTGCKMCADVCPVQAIKYVTDGEGFWYPEIDTSKCINCHLCENICPQNEKFESRKEYPHICAAWIKDDAIRLKSTSGGVFYALAKQMILNDGYVIGCRYGKDYKSAYHEVVHTLEELNELVGSKYFQSDTNHIYARTKEILEQEKDVLFCGTPCQIAALYKFLGKEYSKLITMDFICLGINSPKAFREYVSEQEKKNKAAVSFVQLKNKKQGWYSLASYMEFTNGRIFLANKDEDLWIKGYIKDNLYMRKSCFQCQYRKLPRVADISVGDFWGITNVSKTNLFKGISAVMINSEKGNNLFDFVKKDLCYQEKSMKDLKGGNPALEVNPIASENRTRFFEYLQTMPFSKAVKKSGSYTGQKFWSKYMKTETWFRFMREKPLEYLKENNLLGRLDLKNFLFYNYCCSNIKRDEGVYLLPYKNSVIDLEPTAIIRIRNKNIELGINKLKNSKAETYLRMGKNAQWISNRGAGMFYDTVLEVCNNAKFESGFFTANGGSVIVCAKHIVFGDNVMLGRNIMIYDSDHHQILDENGRIKNHGQDVVIEDHVWLTSNVTILKGVHIGKESIVGAQMVITKDLPSSAFVVGSNRARILNQKAKWSRKTVQ